MLFQNKHKIKSSIFIGVVLSVFLTFCSSKPRAVNELLIGKWQLKIDSLNNGAESTGRKVTFTYAEDKSCTYEFFNNNISEKKVISYYLLLNDEKVIANYYDNLFVEIQEQFDIVKLDENKLELKERKVNGQSLSLERVN